MPQKSSAPVRTWGTRFDTLPTSPPLSPPVLDSVADHPTPSNASEPLISDPLPKTKEQKMPHDASVFVGSLPSTIDQHELTRLLSEHLSDHAEVKNIKVVRDSKGGVCAFVQCEDATSAAILIHTLHSNPPRSFLGRNLRYEPARAFRTLLISYRTPMQHVLVNSGECHLPPGYHPQNTRTVKLDLPFAMRVWRPKASKFYSLLYNAEAVNAENNLHNDNVTTSEIPSLFLQPVVFDGETIRTLAAHFGSLESISLYQLPDRIDSPEKAGNGSITESSMIYPAPHDSLRSIGMDTRCWEIKWEHRDDCVSALMTLRRVPHLTVTWAHQPPTGLERRSPYQNNQYLNTSPYPLHAQGRPQSLQPRAGSFSQALHFPLITDEIGSSPSEPLSGSSCIEIDIPGDEDSSDVIAKSAVKHNSVKEELVPVRRTEWSDTDFPPLTSSSAQQYRTGYGVWKEKKLLKEEEFTESSFATISQQDVGLEPMAGLSEEASDSRGQDLELEASLTPGLGRSPITPQTPGSIFPSTPTSNQDDAQPLPFKELEEKDEYSGELTRTERDLDPTTLFVGGLETFGPGAWDEEKVAKFFSRFGGLESVKVVRPQNSHAAFAFVKFNNTQSPARAVLEEHNRVYEGRAMRVQLRDCNPPRGYWRYSRGRSRFQPNLGSHGRLPGRLDKLQERSSSSESHGRGGSPANPLMPSSSAIDVEEVVLAEPEPPAYSEKSISKPAEGSGVSTRNPPTQPRVSSPEPSPVPPNLPSSESYREWYDEPLSAVLTPPPSSFGSSTSAPASVSPYPIPSGYYGPPQWVHPYAPQFPYQIPYMGYGYPGYRPSSQQLPHTFSRSGSDISVPTVPGPWAPIGVYGSYIPYQTQTVRTLNMDAAQPQQPNNRAPLAPTGFIQNEQGTLIAVYQPEALDQYMASTNAAGPAIPQPAVPSIPSWPQFPQSHSYHFHGPPLRSTIPSAGNVAWVSDQGFIPQQHSTPHITQTPTHLGNVMGFRGGYNDGGGQAHPPHFRRQATRRDHNNSHNHQGRSNHLRPFTNRNSRGNMNNAGYHTHGDARGSRAAQLNQNSGEWNQLGSNR